ncbi:MAG: universal stress protein [Flavobacteriaceae bacterium]
MSTPRTIFSICDVVDDPKSVEYAVTTAAKAGAHLVVALIGIRPMLPVDINGSAPVEWWTQENEKVIDQLAAVGRELGERFSRENISGEVVPHHVGEESVMSVAATHARYADISLGLPKTLREGRIWGSAMPGLLFHSGRPMLLPAEGRTPNLSPERVLVAWNGSKEAAAAVYASIDFLKSARTVHVTMVDPVAEEERLGEEPGNDIGAYLARHGISIVVDRLPSEGRGVGHTILRHANDVDADLIVAGAYGHSRLREFVFGGVTLSLMEAADRPVLFAH